VRISTCWRETNETEVTDVEQENENKLLIAGVFEDQEEKFTLFFRGEVFFSCPAL